MGAAESSIAGSRQSLLHDEITMVSERAEAEDPLLARIRALKIATPLLHSTPQSETSLTDILVRKPASSSGSSANGTLDPNFLLELFSMFRKLQEEEAKRIAQKQEDIENKIETADALAAKLLQRYTHSVSTMRTTSLSLSEVHLLQVEVGELKGRLTEAISNCDALCKRITLNGPESLQTAIQPFCASREDTTGLGSTKDKE